MCRSIVARFAFVTLPIIGIVGSRTLAQPAEAAGPEIVALHAAGALIVETGEIIDDAVVLVRGDRIERVGTRLDIPDGARTIELGDLMMLPGLIDAHTHLAIQPDYAEVNPILYKSIPYRAIEAAAAARTTLMAGFTTIRDVDSEGADWADVAVRDAINNGVIPGPRMQVATLAISITGGYMNQVGLAPQIDVPQYGSLVDTPDELVPEVRRQIKYGADLIKVYATGTTRNVDLETMKPLTQLSFDDLKTIVDEAARFGKPVAAHAYGGDGARNAVRAGVRSIEHGMLLDDETLQMMVERGTFWVPTLSVYMEAGPRSEWPELTRKLVESHERVFKRALELGVKIAYGTDVGAIRHGENAIDLGVMVKYGMSPLEAIQSATLRSAALMELAGNVGTLDSGAFADVIAVPGNPLDDISVLGHVAFVMKGGVVYQNP